MVREDKTRKVLCNQMELGGGLYWLQQQQKWGIVCVCVCVCVSVVGRPEPSFSRGRHWEALSSVSFIQICIGHPLVPTIAQTLDVPWKM